MHLQLAGVAKSSESVNNFSVDIMARTFKWSNKPIRRRVAEATVY